MVSVTRVKRKVCHAPDWAVKYLRRIFAPALGNVVNKMKAIYLIRGDARWRRVKNEEEVIEHLAKSGIESLDLSQHTFLEQIEIISNAHDDDRLSDRRSKQRR